jgi:hypothetical protein
MAIVSSKTPRPPTVAASPMRSNATRMVATRPRAALCPNTFLAAADATHCALATLRSREVLIRVENGQGAGASSCHAFAAWS